MEPSIMIIDMKGFLKVDWKRLLRNSLKGNEGDTRSLSSHIIMVLCWPHCSCLWRWLLLHTVCKSCSDHAQKGFLKELEHFKKTEKLQNPVTMELRNPSLSHSNTLKYLRKPVFSSLRSPRKEILVYP